jgi:hypothetical protein
VSWTRIDLEARVRGRGEEKRRKERKTEEEMTGDS